MSLLCGFRDCSPFKKNKHLIVVFFSNLMHEGEDVREKGCHHTPGSLGDWHGQQPHPPSSLPASLPHPLAISPPSSCLWRRRVSKEEAGHVSCGCGSGTQTAGKAYKHTHSHTNTHTHTLTGVDQHNLNLHPRILPGLESISFLQIMETLRNQLAHTGALIWWMGSIYSTHCFFAVSLLSKKWVQQ